MKHHFADHLDRDGDYWTIVPNHDRYRMGLDHADASTKAVTVFGTDVDLARVRELPALEELTLHEPGKEQWRLLEQLPRLRRLRITHARPRDLTALAAMVDVEELVLEYVSGFSDLSPLAAMPKLRALHLENLRRVRSFDGLRGAEGLKFLSVNGTLDWKQPIEDFEFLRGLPGLEVLALWQVINRTPFPATLPMLSLANLKKFSMSWSVLSSEECALLEVGLAGVEGASWGPWTEFTRSGSDGVWLEFTGKGAGATKQGSKNAAARCAAFAEKYEQLKARAAEVIEAARRAD